MSGLLIILPMVCLLDMSYYKEGAGHVTERSDKKGF